MEKNYLIETAFFHSLHPYLFVRVCVCWVGGGKAGIFKHVNERERGRDGEGKDKVTKRYRGRKKTRFCTELAVPVFEVREVRTTFARRPSERWAYPINPPQPSLHAAPETSAKRRGEGEQAKTGTSFVTSRLTMRPEISPPPAAVDTTVDITVDIKEARSLDQLCPG